jgi:hypothetical protein
MPTGSSGAVSATAPSPWSRERSPAPAGRARVSSASGSGRFVVIPEDVYELGRPLSRVPVQEQIQGAVRITRREELRLEEQHILFGIDEAEAEVYQYATHFRRQLKARLLNDKTVTQIVRETTLAPNDFLKGNGQRTRRLEDTSLI